MSGSLSFAKICMLYSWNVSLKGISSVCEPVSILYIIALQGAGTNYMSASIYAHACITLAIVACSRGASRFKGISITC